MNNLPIAESVIQEIIEAFPEIKIEKEENGPVELSISIPEQNGLKHKIWLGLQNGDELHFQVGHFWISCFPCTNELVKKQFVESVIGFISGEYRVLEHYRGNRCVKSELQVPKSNLWETIGTSSSWFSLPIPRKITFRELRNA